jgi:hypothetical protein
VTALAFTASRLAYLPRRAAGADRAIRVSTAIVVLSVAGIAAYVSYWHAYAVVREYGEAGVTARLEPVTIDGLVYASSMVILYAARHQVPVPRLSRWLLALGIVATLGANMAQGWSHGPGGMVVAAWPAVSLVGSYELLVWIIRKAAAEDPQGERAGPGLPPGIARLPGTGAAGGRGQPTGPADDSQPLDWAAGRGRTDGPRVGAESQMDARINAAAVAAYRASVESGRPLSERKLAGEYGKTSRRWARNRIAEARQASAVPA